MGGTVVVVVAEVVVAGLVLAGDVVVVLGLVEETVVAGGLMDDPVVGDAVGEDTVVEDTAVASGVDPGVDVVWLVGSAGEVFGVTEVGSDGSMPPGGV